MRDLFRGSSNLLYVFMKDFHYNPILQDYSMLQHQQAPSFPQEHNYTNLQTRSRSQPLTTLNIKINNLWSRLLITNILRKPNYRIDKVESSSMSERKLEIRNWKNSRKLYHKDTKWIALEKLSKKLILNHLWSLLFIEG